MPFFVLRRLVDDIPTLAQDLFFVFPRLVDECFLLSISSISAHFPYKIYFFFIFFSIFLHISKIFSTFAPQNASFAVFQLTPGNMSRGVGGNTGHIEKAS